MADLVLTDLTGESILKQPGTVAGEQVTLKNLTDCHVYVLDYASEVEVTDCVNCSIFVGPVDGPAIFENCKGCKVAVACQQFRLKSSSDCKIGLYCATQPSITGSTGVEISCWAGAYPGLTSHFSSANLDAKQNNWNKVYDASAEEGAAPNFVLLEDLPTYWEVPIEGAGPCENPVPGPAGQLFSGGVPAPFANGDGAFGGAPAEEDPFGAPAPLPADIFGGSEEDQPIGINGSMEYVPAPPPNDNPRAAAMREMQRTRLKEQAELEATRKNKLREDAGAYLDTYYQRRQEKKDARLKANRDGLAPAPDGTPEGNTPWERVINMIDFQFSRPSGADLTRFKNTLFVAKSKDMPVSAK